MLSHSTALALVAWGVAWFARYDVGSPLRSSGNSAKFQSDLRAAIRPLVPAVFGIVWFVLYFTNAAASFFAWRDYDASPRYTYIIALLAANLLLNKLWSPLFFGMRAPRAALVDLLLLLLVTGLLLVALARDARHAGWTAFGLFTPYALWLLVAAVLNVRFIGVASATV